MLPKQDSDPNLGTSYYPQLSLPSTVMLGSSGKGAKACVQGREPLHGYTELHLPTYYSVDMCSGQSPTQEGKIKDMVQVSGSGAPTIEKIGGVPHRQLWYVRMCQ